MVTREVRMDIVMLHRQGLSKRQIAKRLGIHRDTVSGYLERSHWCSMYLSGLLLDGERKSIEPMAARLPDGNEQAMQQFVNQSPWDPSSVLNRLVEVMADHLRPSPGVLVLDDTSLPKKGMHSVGVARQYCGALGKVANCQSVVSWHFAGEDLHFPLVGELYLPKAWTEDSSRMIKAGVPPERTTFVEKWRLALSLLDRVKGKVPYEAITFDAGYGEIRVSLAHRRWTVEQGYQQLKEELGLDHFEGRSWQGLHHHVALCFMAFCFLVLLQGDHQKKLPDLAADNPPVDQHPPHNPDLSPLRENQLPEAVGFL